MTENMEPVETGNTDNSSQEPVEMIVTSKAESEPASDIQTAEQAELKEAKDISKEVEEKLYANKYKSIEELEKGYKEAERFINKAADLEKQLGVYREQEEKSKMEREMQARQQGFSDTEEQKISTDVAIHEYNLFTQALEAGYAGDNYDAAISALSKYQQTGNPNDLANAKKLFLPEALEIIAENRKAFKDEKLQEYNLTKRQSQFNTAKQNLEAFVKETGDWINQKEHQEIIGSLFNEFGGDLDMHKAKSMIETIEQGAIERYKTSMKAQQEQKSRTQQMQAPTGISQTTASSDGSADWRDAESDAEMKKIVSKYL